MPLVVLNTNGEIAYAEEVTGVLVTERALSAAVYELCGFFFNYAFSELLPEHASGQFVELNSTAAVAGERCLI